jgi:hypothetical protein
MDDLAGGTMDCAVFGSPVAAALIVKNLINACKKQLLSGSWSEDLDKGVKLLGMDKLPLPPRSQCIKCGHHDDRSGSHELRWCGGCFAVRYCSKQCQKDDRKDHKGVCGPGMRTGTMSEYEYACLRMFNETFRLLMTDVTPRRWPLLYIHRQRMKFRSWQCRIVCEQIGAVCAREYVDILVTKIGADKIYKFCVAPSCTSEQCLARRKEFEKRGYKIELGPRAFAQVKSSR